MNIVITILTLFLITSSCAPKENEGGGEIKEKKVETFYTCSMHPQIKEKAPGKCPICFMGLTKIEIDHSADHNSHKSQSIDSKDIYYCEVDPSVTSEVPGECPLDGSTLLKKEILNDVVAKVKLRKSQIKHFRSDVFKVTTMKMQKNIRLLGTLLKSENRESNIPARVSGRVEEVFVQSTGSLVKKGDPVLKLYSPQLLTGGDEYLIARRNYLANKENKEFKDLYLQSTQRLKLWGVLEKQLLAWSKANKIPREITIYSPVTGIVEKKNAVKGKYFKEGQSFFDLVDLNSLWVEMDVYEHDSALVNLNQKVKIEFSAYPGEIWNGEIDFVNPVLDQKTRTLKVRTTLKNMEGKLRPGMVGEATLYLEYQGLPLVIPRTAVIDTGKRKVVWVDIGNDVYQAKRVHTGFESEGYVEIKKGLTEGERIVIDGNFLLDAQAQLFGGYQDEPEQNQHKH